MTTYHYNGLTSSVIGGGEGETERRMLSWQQQNHLSSTSLTTRGSTVKASRADDAYGAERAPTGDLQTDHPFTGHKRDETSRRFPARSGLAGNLILDEFG